MTQDSERPQSEGESQSFAQFLQAAPRLRDAADRVTLTGVVYRTDNEDSFVLVTPEGQALELRTDAVQQYSLLNADMGSAVQIQVSADALGAASGPGQGVTAALQTFQPAGGILGGGTLKAQLKDPIHDTLKEQLKDPIRDTLKEQLKDPIRDTLKEQLKDPIRDTNPLADYGFIPGGPMQPDPVGPVSGLTPFVMATPHHAPQAAVMLQGMAGTTQNAQGTAAAGALTPAKHPLADGGHVTIKELLKDPLYETYPGLDLRKLPAYDVPWPIDPNLTLVEGTYPADPWGSVVNPGVWNLPGLMF